MPFRKRKKFVVPYQNRIGFNQWSPSSSFKLGYNSEMLYKNRSILHKGLSNFHNPYFELLDLCLESCLLSLPHLRFLLNSSLCFSASSKILITDHPIEVFPLSIRQFSLETSVNIVLALTSISSLTAATISKINIRNVIYPLPTFFYQIIMSFSRANIFFPIFSFAFLFCLIVKNFFPIYLRDVSTSSIS